MAQSQTSGARDAALLSSLRAVLASALARAPALAKQIEGFDVAALQSRADLARLPILRKSDLAGLQAKALLSNTN